jgi:hypothetical protein
MSPTYLSTPPPPELAACRQRLCRIWSLGIAHCPPVAYSYTYISAKINFVAILLGGFHSNDFVLITLQFEIFMLLLLPIFFSWTSCSDKQSCVVCHVSQFTSLCAADSLLRFYKLWTPILIPCSLFFAWFTRVTYYKLYQFDALPTAYIQPSSQRQ